MILFSFQMRCGYSPCIPETMFCTEDCSVLRVSALMCNYGKHALKKSFLKYSKVHTLLAVARQVSESPPGFLVCVCVCVLLFVCMHVLPLQSKKNGVMLSEFAYFRRHFRRVLDNMNTGRSWFMQQCLNARWTFKGFLSYSVYCLLSSMKALTVVQELSTTSPLSFCSCPCLCMAAVTI